ncbi:MAG: GNAT family N-acetyltransferase [Gammaproteobacteria bacterium]
MDSLNISIATRNEIPDMAALLNLLFSQEADFRPDADKQTVALEHIIDTPETGIIFVAKLADRTVGMVSVLFLVSTAEGGRVGLIEDMVVTPELRNRGIGSRLLKYAIAHAEDIGLKRLTLLTDAPNKSAQTFYARFGFSASAMLPMRKWL